VLTNEFSCCIAVSDGETEASVEDAVSSEQPQTKADDVSSEGNVSSELRDNDGDRRQNDDDGSNTRTDKMTVCRNSNSSYNDKFPR